MGIIADIEETKQLWKDSSLTFKVILVISTFLATGSIASISDIIFEWKGFVLDAITFYQELIGHPIREFFSKFDLSYTQGAFDYLTLSLIYCSSGTRWLWMQGGRTKGDVPMNIGLTVLLLGVFVFLCIKMEGVEIKWIGFKLAIIMTTFVLTPILLQYKSKIVWYFPFLVACSVTLLAGAINAGLTR